jgi:hypothetical protein
MDHRETASDRQLLPIFDRMFDWRTFDRNESDEQPKQDSRPQARCGFHRPESFAGCCNRRIDGVHVSVGSCGFLERGEAADVIRMCVRQKDAMNIRGLLPQLLASLKYLVLASG